MFFDRFLAEIKNFLNTQEKHPTFAGTKIEVQMNIAFQVFSVFDRSHCFPLNLFSYPVIYNYSMFAEMNMFARLMANHFKLIMDNLLGIKR